MAKIYNADLIGKKQSVVDEILLLNQHQTPLLNLLGFAEPVTQVEHAWFEDELFGSGTTVAGAVTNVATSVVVADVEPFRVNHVVKVNEELMLVTAVNVGTKTLTVTRGYAGTTAATITDGTKIDVQFVEGQEGRDARDARNKPRVRKSNFTQIFDDTIDISGTATAVEQFGVGNFYEYEKQKKQLELALQLEKALIGGVKYESGNIRQMGGIRSLITSNVTDAAAAALSATMLNDSLQKIYEKGGFNGGGNYVIIAPAKQKRVISGLQSENVKIDRQDNGRGSVVDHFVSDFGQFEILLNNNLASNELFIVDKNRMKVRSLVDREFFHKYLGEVGDSTRGMIVGEYTLEFKQEKAHARIKNLA
jgi:hypothetical protein